jgi:erythromycin esterase-like protein
VRRFSDEVLDLAAPLDDPGDFDVLLDRIGDARIVMLGEASHGTSEFYRWRSALTVRLVAERGFSFVAVEGDWPDCDRVDRSVRCRAGYPADPRAALRDFARWPTWMWANEEVVDFCRWLRQHNTTVDPRSRVGFHGLDLYSLWESMHEIVRHLRRHDPERLALALRAYRCFEPYGEAPPTGGFLPAGCAEHVVELLTAAHEHAAAVGAAEDAADEFSALQNAETVAGAERYYRALTGGGPDAWNIRDTHMADTLDRLSRAYGPDARAVVWAHNSHVGDARATDRSESGEVSLGQLARERHGDAGVVLVGLGTHRGTVLAGPSWGGAMDAMPLPPARDDSVEDIMHGAELDRALFVFPATGRPDVLEKWLAHRAVGVVYQPAGERLANYVPTRLGDRYDAFCWFDETRALHPLPVRHVEPIEPETYPAGV